MALGVADGSFVGTGDGIIVGEHIGGLPSGESLNIGLSGAHSVGQHMGQPIINGNGRASQSGLFTGGPKQLKGRAGSSNGKKHVASGHSSITSKQFEGISLGLLEFRSDGDGDGFGDGKGVGSQPALSLLSSRHSSGQHSGQFPVVGNGRMLQSCRPKEPHVGGRSAGLISQHVVGHSSIK